MNRLIIFGLCVFGAFACNSDREGTADDGGLVETIEDAVDAHDHDAHEHDVHDHGVSADAADAIADRPPDTVDAVEDRPVELEVVEDTVGTDTGDASGSTDPSSSCNCPEPTECNPGGFCLSYTDRPCSDSPCPTAFECRELERGETRCQCREELDCGPFCPGGADAECPEGRRCERGSCLQVPRPCPGHIPASCAPPLYCVLNGVCDARPESWPALVLAECRTHADCAPDEVCGFTEAPPFVEAGLPVAHCQIPSEEFMLECPRDTLVNTDSNHRWCQVPGAFCGHDTHCERGECVGAWGCSIVVE